MLGKKSDTSLAIHPDGISYGERKREIERGNVK
jgi:hypothetical protein